jgi:hypothetical protein
LAIIKIPRCSPPPLSGQCSKAARRKKCGDAHQLSEHRRKSDHTIGQDSAPEAKAACFGLTNSSGGSLEEST